MALKIYFMVIWSHGLGLDLVSLDVFALCLLVDNPQHQPFLCSSPRAPLKLVQVQYVQVQVQVQVQVLLPVVLPWRRPSPSSSCLAPTWLVTAS